MITIKNLNKYYNKGKKNEQHVLNDINLELGKPALSVYWERAVPVRQRC